MDYIGVYKFYAGSYRKIRKMKLPYHLRLGLPRPRSPISFNEGMYHSGPSLPELFLRIENQMDNQMENEMESGFILV